MSNFSVIVDGVTIPQWSANPVQFNGSSCKKIYFNGVLTYNYLSMNYTANIGYTYPFGGCAGTGYSGAYLRVTRVNDSTYNLYLYASNMAADYRWKGSAVSSSTNVTMGSNASISIRYAYRRDQTTLLANVAFASDGKLNIKIYHRCKDYLSYTLRSQYNYEG